MCFFRERGYSPGVTHKTGCMWVMYNCSVRRAFWVIFVGQSLYLFEVRHKILQRIFSKEYVFLASLRHVLVATKEVKRGRNLEVSNFTTFSLHHFSISSSNHKIFPTHPPTSYFMFYLCSPSLTLSQNTFSHPFTPLPPQINTIKLTLQIHFLPCYLEPVCVKMWRC